MTVIPGRDAVNMASESLEKAKVNIRDSKTHASKESWKSASELQQGVEKSVKAWHLLAGWLHPLDQEIRDSTGHESYRLWVDNLLPFYAHVQDISKALIDLAEKMPGTNLLLRRARQMSNESASLTPTLTPQQTDSLQKELDELSKLHISQNRPIMWKASLNLDRNNKWIHDAMDSLDQPDIVSSQTIVLCKLMLPLVSATHLLEESTPDRILFTMSLGRGMKDTLWLPVLTAWHDQPARYAAAADTYWNANAYTKSTPFVKLVPKLTEHANKMNDESSKAAMIAGKLNP